MCFDASQASYLIIDQVSKPSFCFSRELQKSAFVLVAFWDVHFPRTRPPIEIVSGQIKINVSLSRDPCRRNRHIKLCLLLLFYFFKTISLLLCVLRDFSVMFPEIKIEQIGLSRRLAADDKFFPTVASLGKRKQTNWGFVSRFD